MGGREIHGWMGLINWLPPLPFLVAIFTEACHDFLLQVGDREALEGGIQRRRVRGGGGGAVVGGEKLDSVST